jgi:hypothetical protein
MPLNLSIGRDLPAQKERLETGCGISNRAQAT